MASRTVKGGTPDQYAKPSRCYDDEAQEGVEAVVVAEMTELSKRVGEDWTR